MKLRGSTGTGVHVEDHVSHIDGVDRGNIISRDWGGSTSGDGEATFSAGNCRRGVVVMLASTLVFVAATSGDREKIIFKMRSAGSKRTCSIADSSVICDQSSTSVQVERDFAFERQIRRNDGDGQRVVRNNMCVISCRDYSQLVDLLVQTLSPRGLGVIQPHKQGSPELRKRNLLFLHSAPTTFGGLQNHGPRRFFLVAATDR